MGEKDRSEILKETLENVGVLVSETAKDVKAKAEPVAEKAKIYLDEAAKRAEPVTGKAREYFDEAVKKAEPVTGKAKGYIDEAAKMAEPKLKEAKEALSEQAKKMGLGGPEVYIQFGPYEADMDAIIERVKAAYAEDGNKAGAIRKMKVYVKPEENAVYYVINDDQHFGKISLF